MSAALTSRCLVCGRHDALGLPVCAACGGTSPEVADQLVFVLPEARGGRFDRLRERIAALTGRPAQSEAVEAAARGLRALARVPGSAAPEVVARLEDEGLTVLTSRADRAWAAVPLPFVFLVAMAAAAGVLAGLQGATVFLALTPPFAVLLLLSAVRGVRRPLYEAHLDRAAPRVLVRAISDLPPGQARDLVVDLCQAARVIAAYGPPGDIPASLRRTLDELLPTAAQAAADLAALDQTLADFEARGRGGDPLPETWQQGLVEIRRSRSRLAGYLLEVTGLVGRLQGMSGDGLSSAGARLRELTRELRSGVEALRGREPAGH